MKYIIVINQLVLSKTKLDVIDGAILDYISFLCGSTNPKVEKERITEENNRWTWIDLDTVFREMPLLRFISHSPISRRLPKIIEEGYIETLRKSNHRLYIRLTPKYDELVLQSTSPQAQAGALEHQSYCSTAPNKDNNNKEDVDKDVTHGGSFVKTQENNRAPAVLPAKRLANKPWNDPKWLLNLSPEDVDYFKEEFPQMSTEKICHEAKASYFWQRDKGRWKKDNRSFLSNWLRNKIKWDTDTEIKKGGGIGWHEYN